MSSFSDNFDKSSKSEVQFDDEAFYPFIATIILFSTIAVIIYFIKTFQTKPPFSDNSKYLNCPCSFCKTKLKPSPFQFPYYAFILFISLLVSFYYCYNKVSTSKRPFTSFDPFEILGINQSAELPQIKSSFKKLALKYHPDKNPNNLQAKAKFILITKAYDALTNENAKRNYERYGNPDGPGSMKISVGLPSFILEKKNHMKILICFLITIVIIIPMYFLQWYNNASQFDQHGVMNATDQIYSFITDENSSLMHIPFYIGLAKEFAIEQDAFYATIDGVEVNRLREIFQRFFPKINVIPSVLTDKNWRAICECYAYLFHIKTAFGVNEERLKTIARLIDHFLLLQIEKTVLIKKLADLPRPPTLKMIKDDFIKDVILFQQCFIQGIRVDCCGNNYAPFLQLKLLSLEQIKPIVSKVSFDQFIKSDDKTKRSLLWNECQLNKEDIIVNEVIQISHAFPVYDFKIEPMVEGFEDFVKGDIVTYKITITRGNLDENLLLGVVHSNHFPDCFNESIQIVISNEGTILHQIKVGINQRVTKSEFRLNLSNIGTMRLMFKICSTSYLGLDKEIDVYVTSSESSSKRKAQIQRIEKKKVKLGLSYFQTMLIEAGMMMNRPEDEEDEEEQEEQEKDDNDNDNNDKGDNDDIKIEDTTKKK